MSEQIRTYVANQDFLMFETRGVLIGLYHDMMKMDNIAIRRALQDMSKRLQGRGATIAIYRSLADSYVNDPPKDSRDGAAEMMRLIDTQVSAVASVILPTGFSAAALRAVITGLMLMVRPKYAFKTFSAIPEAMQWVSGYLPEKGGPDCANHLIRTVMEQMAQQDAMKAARGTASSR